MKAILLDIEGTTTPIDFVHKTLFPFARQRIAAYVATNLESLGDEIEQLRLEHEKELGYADHFDPHSASSVAKYLAFLIDNDRKSTPLKSIQGEIWKSGYESGELRSVVFNDVPTAFERWTGSGIRIAIYSSGSVLAQQLLFRYTDHGDLTSHISAWFDTNVGGKREPESYARIAGELDAEAGEILFCSDVVAELDAARHAGLATALTLRPGNAELEGDVAHRIVESFEAL